MVLGESYITKDRQPGAHLEAHVRSQSEGPGVAQQHGARAPTQRIWKGEAGYEQTPAQQLLEIPIHVVVEKASCRTTNFCPSMAKCILVRQSLGT